MSLPAPMLRQAGIAVVTRTDLPAEQVFGRRESNDETGEKFGVIPSKRQGRTERPKDKIQTFSKNDGTQNLTKLHILVCIIANLELDEYLSPS